MGEIAEMMLDGTLCEGCGVALDGDAPGYPRRCASCRKEQRAENHQATLARHQQVKKVPCPTCGKKVKAVGLADHQRDSHGVPEAFVPGFCGMPGCSDCEKHKTALGVTPCDQPQGEKRG